MGRSTPRLPSQSSLIGIGNDSHFSLNTGSNKHRTKSALLSEASGSIVEDGILELFLYCDITRSIPDVLHGISTPIEEVDDQLSNTANGSDYLMPNSAPASIKPPLLYGPAPLLQRYVVETLFLYLDFPSYKSMRPTCRSWHSALASAASAKFPASYNLPNEIIQHIYEMAASTISMKWMQMAMLW